MIRLDVFLAAEIFVNPFPERSGSFSVNHPHSIQMGEQRVIEIFIKFSYGLVNGSSEQVDFRADRERFAHPDLSFGSAVEFLRFVS